MMNPFLVNKEFELQVATVITNSTQKSGARILRTTEEFLVEVQKKVTVYKTGNNAQYTAYLFSMNRYARDIYLYMQANIGEDQDTIKLDSEKICEVCDMGRDSYYKGIDDLKTNSIITVFKANTFWINPFILFRGDRLAYYTEQCPDCINKVVIVNSTANQDKSA